MNRTHTQPCVIRKMPVTWNAHPGLRLYKLCTNSLYIKTSTNSKLGCPKGASVRSVLKYYKKKRWKNRKNKRQIKNTSKIKIVAMEHMKIMIIFP